MKVLRKSKLVGAIIGSSILFSCGLVGSKDDSESMPNPPSKNGEPGVTQKPPTRKPQDPESDPTFKPTPTSGPDFYGDEKTIIYSFDKSELVRLGTKRTSSDTPVFWDYELSFDGKRKVSGQHESFDKLQENLKSLNWDYKPATMTLKISASIEEFGFKYEVATNGSAADLPAIYNENRTKCGDVTTFQKVDYSTVDLNPTKVPLSLQFCNLTDGKKYNLGSEVKFHTNSSEKFTSLKCQTVKISYSYFGSRFIYSEYPHKGACEIGRHVLNFDSSDTSARQEPLFSQPKVLLSRSVELDDLTNIVESEMSRVQSSRFFLYRANFTKFNSSNIPWLDHKNCRAVDFYVSVKKPGSGSLGLARLRFDAKSVENGERAWLPSDQSTLPASELFMTNLDKELMKFNLTCSYRSYEFLGSVPLEN